MMINKNAPQPKSLLLSEPFMLDPNFRRAVVLLCEHNEEGSLGFVLSQTADVLLNEVTDELPSSDFKLYIGGPVEQNSLQFIHKCFDKLHSGIALGDGIYWGGNFETLRVLMERREISNQEIRFFLGYSGWAAGQLEMELKENTWMVCNDYHPDLVFFEDEENLWKEAVVALGPKYAHIAQFPENPMWN